MDDFYTYARSFPYSRKPIQLPRFIQPVSSGPTGIEWMASTLCLWGPDANFGDPSLGPFSAMVMPYPTRRHNPWGKEAGPLHSQVLTGCELSEEAQKAPSAIPKMESPDISTSIDQACIRWRTSAEEG